MTKTRRRLSPVNDLDRRRKNKKKNKQFFLFFRLLCLPVTFTFSGEPMS